MGCSKWLHEDQIISRLMLELGHEVVGSKHGALAVKATIYASKYTHFINFLFVILNYNLEDHILLKYSTMRNLAYIHPLYYRCLH